MESIEQQIRGLFPQYEEITKFQLLITDHDDWMKIGIRGGTAEENRKEGEYVAGVLQTCGCELIEGSVVIGRDYTFSMQKMDILDNRIEAHKKALTQMTYCFRPTVTHLAGTVTPAYGMVTPTGFECCLLGNPTDCDAVYTEASTRLAGLGYQVNRLAQDRFSAQLAKPTETR